MRITLQKGNIKHDLVIEYHYDPLMSRDRQCFYGSVLRSSIMKKHFPRNSEMIFGIYINFRYIEVEFSNLPCYTHLGKFLFYLLRRCPP